jgi:hypothetical protein
MVRSLFTRATLATLSNMTFKPCPHQSSGHPPQAIKEMLLDRKLVIRLEYVAKI